MYIVCVTVWVQEGHAEEFIEATLGNHRGTRQEPGNARFDVSRATDDPNRFFIYEAYVDEEAFKAHQLTPHYLAWRDRVNDWMAQRRQGVRYISLAPEDPQAW